ncbi:MAG: penicillin-binding protein activator [Leptospirillia bacterium]
MLRSVGLFSLVPWMLLALLWAGVSEAQPIHEVDLLDGSRVPDGVGLEDAFTDVLAFDHADALFLSGDMAGAAAAYKQALAAFPDTPRMFRSLYRLGYALQTLGREDEMQPYWERLLAEAPDSPFAGEVANALLDSYRRRGELDKALDILLGRLGKSRGEEKAQVLWEVAQVRIDLGEPERAIKDLLRRQHFLPPEQRAEGGRSIKEVIDNRLAIVDLEGLSDQFPDPVPGAWIVERLVRSAVKAKDTYLIERWAKRYLERYGNQPFANQVKRIVKQQRKEQLAHQHRIGALMHLNGELGVYGERVLNGIRLAHRLAQASLPAGEVSLWVRNQDDPEPFLRSHIGKLVADASPEVVIGPLLSAEVARYAKEIESDGIPLIAPLVPPPDVAGAYVVGLGVTPEAEAVAAARYAYREAELTRLVVLAPEGAYGQRIAMAFRDELERLGGTVQTTVFYPKDNARIRKLVAGIVKDDLRRDGIRAVEPEDMSHLEVEELEIAGLLEAPEDEEIFIGIEPEAPLQGPPVGPHPYFPGFDGVFLAGSWDQVVLVAPHLPFHDVNLPIIGSSGWGDVRLIRKGGSAVSGARFVAPFHTDSVRAGAFVKAYRAAYGEAPDLFAALGFDAYNLALGAARNGVGPMESRLSGPFEGVTGGLVVQPDGAVERDFSVLTVRRKGFREISRIFAGTEPDPELMEVGGQPDLDALLPLMPPGVDGR